MSNTHHSNLDCLIIGEAIIDLISEDFTDSLSTAFSFNRYAGGQAANTAVNLARLGNTTALAASVGKDGFGLFLTQAITNAGVRPDFIQHCSEAATTLSVITRHTQTPDFIIARGADGFLQPDPNLLQQARTCRFIHTSAFALSRDPSRCSILEVLEEGKTHHALVSIDPNYHPAIWPDIQNYIEILAQAVRFADFVKPSADDCIRLFGPDRTPQECASCFFEWGAQHVLLTMGTEGTLLFCKDGGQYLIQPGKVKVVDVTGAGDAFWAGFITAVLDGKDKLESARIGQALAEIKVATLGPMQEIPDRKTLYAL
ncbi:MAG: hypothetical protein JXA25_13695, partial [Anaerolineales bacterium]|nr:hypothetical protein [Anaerolineales bacterium]